MTKKLTITKWNLTDNTGLEYCVTFSPSTGVRQINHVVAVDNTDPKRRVDITHTMVETFGLDATIEGVINWDEVYADEEITEEDTFYSLAESIVRTHAQSYRH